SAGLVAGGKLFATVFGINYSLAVTIGTVCIISYTLFGGFLAVSWTDLIQGLLMAAALLIVPVAALQSDGGLMHVFDSMNAMNPELLNIWTNKSGEALSAIAIISLVAWGLGYFGQPHILARFAAISHKDQIPTARRIAVTWTAISMVGALFVGFAGMIYVENNMSNGLADAETIFMVLVNSLFHPLIAGILLAAILAAIMSTADSQLLVSSSALAEDFYKALFNKEASPQQVLNVGRVGVVIIALVALLLAFNENSSVLGLVSYAWAGFGAAFGPALILSLYWPRMNKQGALTGIIIGGITIVVWKQLSGGIYDMYEIVPGIIFSTISIIAVSLFTKAPEQDITNNFKIMEESL
ncbi:MAG: sodium/solute symporter, partial [Sinobacterium sp.]|nr:sodium/solute symporter [Sinobacterium sp.]